MPDWLLERGIGETRAVRIEGGEIVEARIWLDGIVPAGAILNARLMEVGVPAIAQAEGQDYLLPAGAAKVPQGASLRIEIVREKIPGAETWKRPLARLSEEPVRAAPPLPAGELPFPSPLNALDEAGWGDLIDEARSGIIRFSGGELRVSVTPAMTLVDVDGRMPPLDLAVAGATAAARAILRHGISGSIGIDLPTVAGKAERQTIAETVDAVLPKPFERTAVNGFGFLQIVRPRRHASLFELAQDRAAFEARALLRHAALQRTGSLTLVAHPAIVRVLEGQPGWLETLGRQVGGAIGLRVEVSLPMSGAYAEPS